MTRELAKVIEESKACSGRDPETPLVACPDPVTSFVVLRCTREPEHALLSSMCERHMDKIEATVAGEPLVPLSLCALCREFPDVSDEDRVMIFDHSEPWTPDHPFLLQMARDQADLNEL